MRVVDAVSKRIEDLATHENISVYALAKKSGVPYPTITTMKLNKTTTLSTIYGICEGLEITMKEFFDSPLFDRENLID